MFLRILVFIICLALSIIILKYTEKVVRLFGKTEYAEKYLGGGGTYTMWKLIGIGLVIGGIIYLAS